VHCIDCGNRLIDGASLFQSVSNAALRLTRMFFVKSNAIIPILVKLIEQGGTSAVRG
jgi:hypothetical protein